MSASITVVGSINLDIVAQGGRLPRAGETVTARELLMVPGGKGANQALAARRLGAEVNMVGAVGEDAHGREAVSLLKADGVNLDKVKHLDGIPTGVALIAVSDDGENQISIVPGANGHVRPDDVADLTGQALICQLEIPVDTVHAAMRGFEGLKVLNLAPVASVPDELLSLVDLIVVNEHELAETGRERLMSSGSMVAVTYGAKGAHLYQDGRLMAEAGAPAITPVDTTGAGDTFTAALTLALLEGQTPESALEFACAAGAAAALKPGAQSSLPQRADVIALLDQT